MHQWSKSNKKNTLRQQTEEHFFVEIIIIRPTLLHLIAGQGRNYFVFAELPAALTAFSAASTAARTSAGVALAFAFLTFAAT